MKATNILLISFILMFSGCSLYNSITKNDDMKIVNAGYKDWTEPPIRGDVPESGTDLAVIVKNWPEDAEPLHIIYKERKSYKPDITDRNDVGVVINARIRIASSVIAETSQKVDLSDRLAYTDANGNTQYIEIEEWTRIDDTPSDEK